MSFTTTFTVDRPPAEPFAAITTGAGRPNRNGTHQVPEEAVSR
ncbi:MAG: hypothetical protein WBA97_17350 [Actinophytocola sp.]